MGSIGSRSLPTRLTRLVGRATKLALGRDHELDCPLLESGVLEGALYPGPRGASEQLDVEFKTTAGKTKMDLLDETLRLLDHKQSDEGAWNTLSNKPYRWDAAIQDRLALLPAQSAAYQLGRGLAETFWALEPRIMESTDPRSWELLLGRPEEQR